MTEEFLQYIWNYRLFDKTNLQTTDGEAITVINQGLLNTDGGPDFFNAKISIGNTLWAGNIEIHRKASDWFVHKHNTNKAYENVILHLAYEIDVPRDTEFNSEHKKIPLAQLVFNPKLLENYQQLLQNQSAIPCDPYIAKTDSFTMSYWLEKMLIERIEEKTTQLETALQQNTHNWEETFYIILSRNFGFNLNSLPFEMLAKSLPIKYLAKHKNNCFQIEAMLFGQAGFLSENIEDEYYTKLKTEYLFLKHKYDFIPIEKHLWKFLRLRPVNFPTLRISQFAHLIFKSNALFSKIIEIVQSAQATKASEMLNEHFDLQASEYWDTHYVFGKESSKKIKRFGSQSFNTILINTIVPFAFAYGKSKANEQLMANSLHLLENISAEKNTIIQKWNNYGHEVKTAYQSQALYHLSSQYCSKKQCLRCAIGNKTIAKVGN